MSKKKLGRGLDALLGAQYSEEQIKNAPVETETKASPSEATSDGGSDFSTKAQTSISTSLESEESGTRLIRIDPKRLKPNPFQPRTVFSDEALNDLSASLKEHGLLQPVVAVKGENGDYIIVAGERRTRAAILANLSEIPVLLTQIDAKQNLELALIENIQRENLNPIEEAQAYKKLQDMYDLSQDELAKKLGKSRPAVANMLRLLQLPDYAIKALEQGSLTAGHARTILSVVSSTEQKLLYDAIVNEGLSVREAEDRASKFNLGKKDGVAPKPKKPTTSSLSPELSSMQQALLEKLGTKVTIQGTEKKGTIEISYFSADDLKDLYEKLLGEQL